MHACACLCVYVCRVCVCVAGEIDRDGIVRLSLGGWRCRKIFAAGCPSFISVAEMKSEPGCQTKMPEQNNLNPT